MDASGVPDHCRLYALSDPTDAEFQSTCDHLHGESCTQCTELEEVINMYHTERVFKCAFFNGRLR